MITKENDKKTTPGKSSPHGTSGATVSSTKPPLPSISGRFVGALMPSLWWLSPAYWIFWYCPKAEAEHKEIFSKSTDSCCSLPPPLRKRSTTSGWCKNKSQDHSVEINQIWSMMSYIYRCVASIYFKMIHFQVRCWTETWDLEGVRHKVSPFSALFRFLFFFLVAMFHILGFAFSLWILFTTKIKKYFTIWLLHLTCSGSTFQPSASFMDQPRERTALSTLETKRRGETIFWKGFAKNLSYLHRVLVVSYQDWSTTTLLPS